MSSIYALTIFKHATYNTIIHCIIIIGILAMAYMLLKELFKYHTTL